MDGARARRNDAFADRPQEARVVGRPDCNLSVAHDLPVGGRGAEALCKRGVDTPMHDSERLAVLVLDFETRTCVLAAQLQELEAEDAVGRFLERNCISRLAS